MTQIAAKTIRVEVDAETKDKWECRVVGEVHIPAHDSDAEDFGSTVRILRAYDPNLEGFDSVSSRIELSEVETSRFDLENDIAETAAILCEG